MLKWKNSQSICLNTIYIIVIHMKGTTPKGGINTLVEFSLKPIKEKKSWKFILKVKLETKQRIKIIIRYTATTVLIRSTDLVSWDLLARQWNLFSLPSPFRVSVPRIWFFPQLWSNLAVSSHSIYLQNTFKLTAS